MNTPGPRRGRPPKHQPAAVLAVFRALTVERGYPPTSEEMAIALGYANPRSVRDHLTTLVRIGDLKRDDTGRLILRRVDGALCPLCALLAKEGTK